MGIARNAVTPRITTEHRRTHNLSRKKKCSRRRLRPSTKKGRKLRIRPRESVVPRSVVEAKTEMSTAITRGQRKGVHTGTRRRHTNRATRNQRVHVGFSNDNESGRPPRSTV